jgi:hypothetical protein
MAYSFSPFPALGERGEERERFASLFDCVADRDVDFVWGFENRKAGNPEDLVALLAQPAIAAAIVGFACGGQMRSTIDFDNQFQFQAAEVDREGRDGDFAPKFLLGDLSVPHPMPHRMCELVCGLSLLPSKSDRIWTAPKMAIHIS